jgi:hypothetical protein
VHADVSFDRYGGPGTGTVGGGKKLVEELVRSTKKNPPKRVGVSLIYVSFLWVSLFLLSLLVRGLYGLWGFGRFTPVFRILISRCDYLDGERCV